MKVLRSICITTTCLVSFSGCYAAQEIASEHMQVYRNEIQKAENVHEAYQVTREFLQEHKPKDQDTIEQLITETFFDRAAKLNKSEAEKIRKEAIRWLQDNAYDVTRLPSYVDWKKQELFEHIEYMKDPDQAYNAMTSFLREYADYIDAEEKQNIIDMFAKRADALSHIAVQEVTSRLNRFLEHGEADTVVEPVYKAYAKQISEVRTVQDLYTQTLQFIKRRFGEESKRTLKTFFQQASEQLQKTGMTRERVDNFVMPMLVHIQDVLEDESYRIDKLSQDARDFYVQVHKVHVQPRETVDAVYRATRQLMQDLPLLVERMDAIYKNVLHSQLASQDARQAQELNRYLKQWADSEMEAADMPKTYQAFTQAVSAEKSLTDAYKEHLREANIERGQDLYEITREFLRKRTPAPRVSHMKALLENAHNVYKGMFDNKQVRDVYMPIARGMQAVLQANDYDVQALTQQYNDFLVQAHAVQIRDADRAGVYAITRTILQLAPEVDAIIDHLLANMDDDSHVAQLISLYVKRGKQPVSNMPQQYQDFEQKMIHTVFTTTFKDALSSITRQEQPAEQDVSYEHAFAAMRNALQAVAQHKDITHAFIDNEVAPALREIGLRTKAIEHVRKQIARYLKLDNAFADIPQTYQDLSEALKGKGAKRLHEQPWIPQFKEMRNALHNHTAWVDDALRVQKMSVAVEHAQQAIEKLYTMWKKSHADLETRIAGENITAENAIDRGLDTVLAALRDIVQYQSRQLVHDNIHSGRPALRGFVSVLYDVVNTLKHGTVMTEYLRDVVDARRPYDLKFDTLYNCYVVFGTLEAADTMVQANISPALIESEDHVRIFREQMLDKVPEQIPEFVVRAGQQFDYNLAQYLKYQIQSNTRANRIDYDDAGSIPSLIRTYHDTMRNEMRVDDQFAKQQYILGYYIRNAQMMLQNGRDIVSTLNSVAGNFEKLPRKDGGVIEAQEWLSESAIRDFVAAYTRRIEESSFASIEPRERSEVRIYLKRINAILQQLGMSPGKTPDIG